MFTGLVQRVGTVRRVSRGAGLVLELAADVPWTKPLEPGESVAVNGVCLMVVKCEGSRFTADVLKETESRTGLADLLPGQKVNLERALRAGDPLGGHLVQGHVDCRGTISTKIPRGRDFRLQIRCGRVLAAQSVLKGSIAIDGVSLTISALGDDWLGVDLIPTTAKETTLGAKKVGDSVNLEGDITGKYIARAAAMHFGPCDAAAETAAVRAESGHGGLTEEALARAGFET